jgi:hypothetical protein
MDCSAEELNSAEEMSDQAEEEKNQENNEQNLSDSCRRNGNTAEAEECCNQRYDEKSKSPT